MANLSIICVNWNSAAYLRDCIASIYERTHEVVFEIIVVDNGSTRGDPGTLQRDYPGVRIVTNDENLGFAKANNLAYARSSGDCLLFLNPDTKLRNPAIDIMVREMAKIPDAGVVGCTLFNSDLSVQTESIQRFPRILNQLLDIECLRRRWPACRLWEIAPLFAEQQHPVRVEVIPGACMLLKREVFEAVGGFSEEYFMYAEDIDLNYKVSRLGLGSYYVGQAQIIHHGGKSSRQQKLNYWATAMKFRAMLMFYRKTRGPFYAGVYRIAMGCAALVRLALLFPMLPFGRVLGRQGAVAGVVGKWGIVLQCAAGLRSWAPEQR